jgi:hypothetical protein
MQHLHLFLLILLVHMHLQLFSRPVDWPEIQAAAAAAAALEACTSTNSAAGDGSIDSYTAGAMATAFVDGYTFNTVGWRLVDMWGNVVPQEGIAVVGRCVCISLAFNYSCMFRLCCWPSPSIGVHV